jgi:hypothetical protein
MGVSRAHRWSERTRRWRLQKEKRTKSKRDKTVGKAAGGKVEQEQDEERKRKMSGERGSLGREAMERG